MKMIFFVKSPIKMFYTNIGYVKQKKLTVLINKTSDT